MVFTINKNRMEIRMVDTVSQYQKIKQEVDQKVLALLDKGHYIGGEAVKEFEGALSTYLGGAQVISCANGTDALQVALMALGCEPGDEILTPSFTYIATVEVIALLRLKPVFVEVNPDTFNMDIHDLERKITPKTKVIMPVHLYGQPADMEPIMAIAKKHQLFVVEDTAQAIGAEYTFADGTIQKVGTIGDIGCTSFYPSKNLGAYGDGGAIFTHNAELGNTMRMICNHGQSRRYYHDSIGVNSRLDAIQAAILTVKLKHLDAYNAARIQAADTYDALFANVEGIQTPFRAPNAKHVFHQYTLRITAGREKRDSIKSKMDTLAVPTMIYYPVPSHLQKAYTEYGYSEGSLPVTEQLTAEVISLPMHSELTEAQINYIFSKILSCLE